MSGGVAYVIDPDGSFGGHFNDTIADLLDVVPDSDDDRELKGMIEKHVEHTGSKVGTKLLANWAESVKQFKKVFPRDYARILRGRAATSESNGTKEGIGSRG
jgi:glutamate synthase (ferredoxin)